MILEDGIQTTLTRLQEQFIARPPARINMPQDLPDAIARGEHGAPASLHRAAHNLALSAPPCRHSKFAAHRAGATRYLTKPTDRKGLLRAIADSAALTPAKPYRVLLMVDDEQSQLAVNSTILRHTGIEVRTADNPLQAIDVLGSFAAEVLLDMRMLQRSDPELATTCAMTETSLI